MQLGFDENPILLNGWCWMAHIAIIAGTGAIFAFAVGGVARVICRGPAIGSCFCGPLRLSPICESTQGKWAACSCAGKELAVKVTFRAERSLGVPVSIRTIQGNRRKRMLCTPSMAHLTMFINRPLAKTSVLFGHWDPQSLKAFRIRRVCSGASRAGRRAGGRGAGGGFLQTEKKNINVFATCCGFHLPRPGRLASVTCSKYIDGDKTINPTAAANGIGDNRWMDGWMDGRMDGRMDGSVDQSTDRSMDRL